MIGIYGGTFNPIHQGHLRAAEEVVEVLGLERMLFIPSARPPHKRADGDEVIAPAKRRLEWVELAIEGNPRFSADPIEVDRPGPSYLVDTLSELGQRYGAEELVFTVGQDAFSEMGSWREPRTLFRLAHIVVTSRPPITQGRLQQWLPECACDDFSFSADGTTATHTDAGTSLRQLPITDLDISASNIRARIREGRSVRYLMPDRVRDAVLGSKCYDVYSDGTSSERKGRRPTPA
jgi:nicotinate-nucleotide adenylyltransferase